MAHRTPSMIGEVQLREILRFRLNLRALLIRERNEPVVAQVTELADGRVARELRDVLADFRRAIALGSWQTVSKLYNAHHL